MSGHTKKEENARRWTTAQQTTKVVFEKLKALGLDQLPADSCILCGRKLSKREASVATFCDKQGVFVGRARDPRTLITSVAPCDFLAETPP